MHPAAVGCPTCAYRKDRHAGIAYVLWHPGNSTADRAVSGCKSRRQRHAHLAQPRGAPAPAGC